jgi:hypothetical protein
MERGRRHDKRGPVSPYRRSPMLGDVIVVRVYGATAPLSRSKVMVYGAHKWPHA